MSAVSFRIARPNDGPARHASSNGHGRRNRHNGYASHTDDSDDSDGGAFAQSIGKRKRDEAITGIDKSGIRYAQRPFEPSWHQLTLSCVASIDCQRYSPICLGLECKWGPVVAFDSLIMLHHSLNGQKEQKQAPLTITAIPHKDFRQAALDLRARKTGRANYVPTAATLPGADGEPRTSRPRRPLSDAERAFLESNSNVQRIGESAVVGGISTRAPPLVGAADQTAPPVEVLREAAEFDTPVPVATAAPLDADALALRELLSSTAETAAEAKVTVIPHLPVTEEDAFRLDLDTRPDSTTLEEYESVPIEDFGAALLRGMSAAMTDETRKSRPEVKPYVPKARTAMLGLGAKSREETLGDLGGAQFGKAAQKESKRDSMRFVPLQKVSKASGMLIESAAASPAASQSNSPRPNGSNRSRDDHRSTVRDSHRDRDDDYRSRRRDREDDEDTRRRRDDREDSHRRRDRERDVSLRDPTGRRDRRRDDDDDDRRHRRER